MEVYNHTQQENQGRSPEKYTESALIVFGCLMIMVGLLILGVWKLL